MIKEQHQILLLNTPLFSKISIDTPLNTSLQLPADACYTYILQGDKQVFSQKENITATSGQVILSLCGLTMGKMLSDLPKGSIYSIIVHFNPKLLKFVFEGEKPAIWKELEKPVTEYVVQSAANALVTHYFNGIINLFDNKEAATDQILKLKLKELILLLLQTNNAENVRQIMNSLFSDKTFSFKELVDAYIFKPVNIENLAMLTNCSVSTFKRKFKEIYHSTPSRYIINQRLEKVAQLLEFSDKNISTIGYNCGFENPEHLSRAFKKKYKISPSRYRKNCSIKKLNF